MTARRPSAVILVENLPVPLDRRAWQEAVALHEAGWDVTVISPRGSGEMRRLRDRIDGIEVLRYPQRAAKGLGGYLVEYLPSMTFTAAWLLHRRARGRIDVVHGCNPPDLFWLFGRIARSEGGAYVFDQHDVGPELATTKWGARGLRARALASITRVLERRSYETADLVLAPNDSYRQIALSRGGVVSDDVLVVRNAPDVTRYRELAANVVVDPHRVGYVGVMGSQDGLDLLLDAWAIVASEPDMTDAVLELVGDGEARIALERHARHLGLGDHVRFHGYRRASEFVPLLATCVVGVSPDPPTPFNDVSTMVKVVDYLAMGRGVVAFDLRETRTVAGDAAVVATPATAEGMAQALLSVMRDPELGRRLGKAGSARVKSIHLDWSRSASDLTGGYARLLDEVRTRRDHTDESAGSEQGRERMNVRIAIMGTRGVPARYGGFETFAEELGARLATRGHDVTVYGRSHVIEADRSTYRGMRLRVLPAIRHKYLDTVSHTALSVFDGLPRGFEVVLICNNANAPFALVPRLTGAKVVLNVDGLEWQRDKWNQLGRAYYRACAWLAPKLPIVLVSDARVIAEWYEQRFGKPTVYIPYGSDDRRLPPGETLARLGLEAERYLLYVSRLEPENHADTVLDAYRAAGGLAALGVPLVIVGDAPYATDYKAGLEATAAATPGVMLTGYVFGDGYVELQTNALLYVQATEVGGTHPALVEAMARGVCIVANDVPEHREVLGEAGRYYRRNDAADLGRVLNELVGDGPARGALGRAARERAQALFSWDRVTDDYEKMFRQLVAPRA